MKAHEEYPEKVNNEAALYLHHLRTGEELEPRFEEAFQKISIARAWILDGYSDTQVIGFLRNDPKTRLQARRAREALNIAYEIFADIRLNRNQDGVKQKYADEINEMAKKIKNEIDSLIEDQGSRKEIAELTKEWKSLKKEAAAIDGAYLPSPKNGGNFKKPTKMIFKRTQERRYDANGIPTEIETQSIEKYE